MTVHLAAPLERLLGELARDHAFGPEVVGPLKAALVATELEADSCWDAGEMLRAFGLIAEQPRSARDRLASIFEILDAPRGKIRVTIKRM
jgi:hypothetical protein